jgi:hypothetical protein
MPPERNPNLQTRMTAAPQLAAPVALKVAGVYQKSPRFSQGGKTAKKGVTQNICI